MKVIYAYKNSYSAGDHQGPERLCLVTCLLLSATLTGSNNYILAA